MNRGFFAFAMVGLTVAAIGVTAHGQDEPISGQAASGAPSPQQPAESPGPAAKPGQEDAKPAMQDLPPEFVKEMETAEAEFKKLRLELAKTLIEMRRTHTLYMNDEERSPEAAEAYRQYRNEARGLMNEAFNAALNLIRYRADEAAATYLVTMIQHRFERDIYDHTTMEAGTRLIDGGLRYVYLFLAAARSAMSLGDFKLARKIYESMELDDLDEIDKSLMARAELIEQQWNQEIELIEKDKQQDHLPRVKLATTRGDVLVELFIDEAPSTVANFIQLVEAGYYDGLDFYQVVDHMLALTGDENGDGSGSTGKHLIDEHQRENARMPLRGSLVMAKVPIGESGRFIPDTASAQFAILYLPLPSVAKEQTVFGRVIQGMDVIGSLRRVDPHKEKKKGQVLLPPDRILSAEVVRRPDVLPKVIYSQPQLPHGAPGHVHPTP